MSIDKHAMGLGFNDEDMTYVIYEKVYHPDGREETIYIAPKQIKDLIPQIEEAERRGYKPVTS